MQPTARPFNASCRTISRMDLQFERRCPAAPEPPDQGSETRRLYRGGAPRQSSCGRREVCHPAGVRLHCTEQRFIRREASDRKSTRLNSSHTVISYAVFCLKKKKKLN